MALNDHYQSSNYNKKFLSIRVLLISTSVLSMALMFKLSLPVITEFTLSELPSFWSVIISWLRPPYLYLIINCIIITIVASARLQSTSKVEYQDQHPQLPPEMATAAALLHTEPVKLVPGADVINPDYGVVYVGVVPKNIEALPVLDQVMPDQFDQNGYSASFAEVPEPDQLYGTIDDGVPETVTMIAVNASEEIKNVNHEFMTSKLVMRSASNKDTTDYSSPRDQRPPVSARFGHRKSSKANPEGGRTLGVTKPKRQDTLESTWKTITEGRAMPLTRHLRKSDTWDTHGHQQQQHEQDQQRMTKSETFNVNQPPAAPLRRSTGSGKLRKDPSLGQDELNRRVEAFIRKFNEDMRLQRQESLNQYMEMINRGAHT